MHTNKSSTAGSQDEQTMRGSSTAASEALICMIPGPVEMFPAATLALASSAISHNDPRFVASFQHVIQYMRPLFGVQSADYQPLVISGGGVMGWDLMASNIMRSPGHGCGRALVITTGVFGNRLAECLASYGVSVTRLALAFRHGFYSHPDALQELETMLNAASPPYRLVTMTQVETSTAVCAPVEKLASIIRRSSPSSLIAVDGVCSIGGVSLQMEQWGIDLAFTASQKCLASVPGLCLMMVSPRALHLSLETRRERSSAYYFDWSRWIPIMKAYESGRSAYFSTPATHAVLALEASLQVILGPIQSGHAKMAERLAAYIQSHEKSWHRVRSALRDELGLQMVCLDERDAATTMSAWYLPTKQQERVAVAAPVPVPVPVSAPAPTVAEWVEAMRKQGVVIAAGLHPEHGSAYFRIGHMGPSATMPSLLHIDKMLSALRIVKEQQCA